MDVEHVAAAVARYLAARSLNLAEIVAAYKMLPETLQAKVAEVGFLEDGSDESHMEAEQAWADFKLVWAPDEWLARQAPCGDVAVRPSSRRRDSHRGRRGHRRVRSARAGPSDEEPAAEPALARWESLRAIDSLMRANRGLVA